jgi:hypothetical protein
MKESISILLDNSSMSKLKTISLSTWIWILRRRNQGVKGILGQEIVWLGFVVKKSRKNGLRSRNQKV